MLENAVRQVITAVYSMAALVLIGIAAVDTFLSRLMTDLGLSPFLQVSLLIIVSLFIIIVVIRVLNGFSSVVLVMLLILLIMHHVLPGFAVPQDDLPTTLQHAASALHS